VTDSVRFALERPEHGAPKRIIGLLAALILASAGGAVAFNGNVVLAAAPIFGFLLLYALYKLPIRVPLLVMTFVALTFENPGDVPAANLWQSPLYPVGKFLLSQLKHSLGVGALVMTGFDVLLALLAGLYVYRRAIGSTIDVGDRVLAPKPLRLVALVMVSAAFAFWGWGLLRGGSSRFALWQVHHVVYLPIMFLFMSAVVPGPAQRKVIARLVVAAACLKAVLAIWIRSRFPDAEYATTHHDSMLFGAATCFVVATLLERFNRKNLLRALWLLPLLVWGMVANDRRLVWAQIGIALVFVFIMLRRTKLKIFVSRAILCAIPVLALYVAAGWSNPSGVFSPVGTIRSMVDSKVDMSSEWRDLENFNLVSTLKSHPLTGTGWGHPFEMAVLLPDVVSEYELEPYLPHNSVLGLWAYTGYVGFTLLWMLLVVGIYFCVRAYRAARDPDDRITALTCVATIMVYVVHCYGDMALGSWTSIYLVSLALVYGGKLAVTTGAWGAKRRSRALTRPNPTEIKLF
jgi:hypothetical protein